MRGVCVGGEEEKGGRVWLVVVVMGAGSQARTEGQFSCAGLSVSQLLRCRPKGNTPLLIHLG